MTAFLLVVTVYNWASNISDDDSNGHVQFKESVKIIHRLLEEAIASITDGQMLVLLKDGNILHSQRRVCGTNDSTWHQVWDMYTVGSYSTSNSTPGNSITFVTSERFQEKVVKTVIALTYHMFA